VVKWWRSAEGWNCVTFCSSQNLPHSLKIRRSRLGLSATPVWRKAALLQLVDATTRARLKTLAFDRTGQDSWSLLSEGKCCDCDADILLFLYWDSRKTQISLRLRGHQTLDRGKTLCLVLSLRITYQQFPCENYTIIIFIFL
jgi:hypothetical protein